MYFPKDSKVYVKNGIKLIQDIVQNDKVLTSDGTFKNVLSMTEQETEEKEKYMLRPKYHHCYMSCDKNQEFLIKERFKKFNSVIKRYEFHYTESKWKKSSEITKTDMFALPINKLQTTTSIKSTNGYGHSKSITLDKLEYWYMMGYFIGDGWVTHNKSNAGYHRHSIYFAVSDQDSDEVMPRLLKLFPKLKKRKKYQVQKCDSYGCTDFHWWCILKQFGKLAYGKFLPEWVQNTKKEYIREFIKGYIEADGHRDKKRNTIELSTVSHNLAYGLQRLLLKIGIISTMKLDKRAGKVCIKGNIYNQRDIYRVRYNLNSKPSGFWLIKDNHAWFKLFKKSKEIRTEKEKVYTLKIENSDNFVLENVIVRSD